jgi:DNA-binding HxlR family transcriptional regulator
LFELTDRRKLILEKIPKNGRITTTDLREETQIKMNVLSAELKILEDANLVQRIVDGSMRPPRVFYRHLANKHQFEFTKEFLDSHFRWILRKQNTDKSWNEINPSLDSKLNLLKQKIVYTNQVLRLFVMLEKTHLKPAKMASDFVEKAPKTRITDYDHSLRFYAYHYFGKKNLAENAVQEISKMQRKSGMLESRRYFQLWFGLLHPIEIFCTYDRERYNLEINKAMTIILRNVDNYNWDDSVSITSWALRMLNYTNKSERFKEFIAHSIDWLETKLNGDKWNLDFEPTEDTITPELACDLTTTSHVLFNICELTEFMHEKQIENCISRPFRWIKSQSKGTHFIGRTKPDPYVSSLAIRAILKVAKFVT